MQSVKIQCSAPTSWVIQPLIAGWASGWPAFFCMALVSIIQYVMVQHESGSYGLVYCTYYGMVWFDIGLYGFEKCTMYSVHYTYYYFNSFYFVMVRYTKIWSIMIWSSMSDYNLVYMAECYCPAFFGSRSSLFSSTTSNSSSPFTALTRQ